MNKVNFTPEHQSQLEKLFLDLSFGGDKLAGKFGAGTVTPYDVLHNMSVTSLKSVHAQIKTEINRKEADTDDWTTSEYDQRQLSLKKKWAEYIHLVIGYKRSEEQQARNSKAIRELQQELETLEASNKTPGEKMAEIRAKINALQGTPAAEVDTANNGATKA